MNTSSLSTWRRLVREKVNSARGSRIRRGNDASRFGPPVATEVLEARCLLSANPIGSLDGLSGGSKRFEGGVGEPIDEDGDVNYPQMVTGAFLTSIGAGDELAMAFDDVIQGMSPTCAFASTLAAVARTAFDLESGIVLQSTSPDSSLYQVRLFEPDGSGGYDAIWIDVPFDGWIQQEDALPADYDEYWTALYQRAYLTLSDQLGANHRSFSHAFGSLTGLGTELIDPSDGARADAERIRNGLNAGRAMVAGTIDADPRILDGAAGIVHDHGYTVLGIEVPPSGTSDIYVTLRNPWGLDTAWQVYDTDDSGDLSTDEATEFWRGLDGTNDGIIRISWAKFSQYFDHVYISDLTGPVINDPQQPDLAPVFQNASIGPFTVHEGEVLEVDLDAIDPNGNTVFYALADDAYGLPGDSPGYIQIQSGNYRWEPLSGEAGTHVITVVAYPVGTHGATASLTFTVNVTSGAPRIGSLTADPISIKDDGSDLLTLTAQDVVHDFDGVGMVEFYRDANGNGLFEADVDYHIGSGSLTNGGNGPGELGDWSWSGYVGGISPGELTFFARAGRYSFSDLHWSESETVTITVTAAPDVPSFAVPVGDQQLVAVGSDDLFGLELTTDAAGNSYTFWIDRYFVPDPDVPQVGTFNADAYMRKFDASGTALTDAIRLTQNVPEGDRTRDIVMLADGSFAAVSNSSVQWFSSSGVAVGNPIVFDSDGAGDGYVDAAADRDGNLLIVYHKGGYFSEDVYAVSISRAGTITRAPWRLNTVTDSMQKYPTVAINGDGEGVIAWTNFISVTEESIVARRVTNYGLSNSDEFTVAEGGEGDSVISAAVNDNGEFLVAWPNYEGDPFGNDIFARRYDSYGQPLTDPFRVNSFRGSTQSSPRVAINDAGWAVIGWTSVGQDPGDDPNDRGAYAQLYDPQGNAAGPAFAVPNSFEGEQWISGMLIDGDADLTFLITDDNSFGETERPARLFLRQFEVNLAPRFTSANTFSLAENSSAETVVGMVGVTDPDPDDTLTYSLVGDSPFAIDAQTGQITVVDAGLFEQTSQFVLSVRPSDDGQPSQSTMGTVTVTINQVNDPGSFGGDLSGSGNEDTIITGTLNFTDDDDGAHNPNFTLSTQPSNGRASIDAATGEWSYIPDPNAHGSDSFVVSVTDDEGNVETKQISITVNSVNDIGAFAGATSGSGNEDTNISGTLTFTDNADGDSGLSFQIEAGDGASNGTATINSTTGAWSYDSDMNFHGSDSFTVSVTDDDGNIETKQISITVSPVSDIGLVVAPKAGYPPAVRVYDTTGQNIRYSFFAYQPSYRGGVKIATGDVNGDGVLDIITAPGSAGVGADIRAYDGTNGQLIRRFFAFAPSFRGGFNVASGDVDGNGIDDIIVSVDAGWKSAVIAFDGQTTQRIGGFFAYGAYRGGVEIATGDVNGDGIDEILTVPGGTGVYAHVKAFRANGQIVSQFVAFPAHFHRGTFNIAAGDVTGDGIDDVIVSVGSVMPPWIRVFNGATPQVLTSILAYPSGFRGGVNIGTGDVNLDGRADILTSTASGALPLLGAFDGVSGQLIAAPPNPYGNFHGGTYVSGNLYDDDTQFLGLDGELIADSNAASLEATQVEGLLAAAAGKFRAAGFSQAVTDQIAESDIRVADLAGDRLAMTRPGTIVFDINAAGWGWFIDETPNLDEEFTRNENGTYRAVADAAQSKVDLLSVLTHEIAHELGFDDLDPTVHGNSLLTATLPTGARRATREHFDDLFADGELMDELLAV